MTRGIAATLLVLSLNVASAAAQSPEVVVHAVDLPARGLYELESWTDSTSPGGKMLGVTNRGDELDPPPENDPNATFTIKVQAGVPYRCWVRMKVGTPMGRSTADLLFVQFSNAIDETKREVLKPRSGDYLTIIGPRRPGWAWVGSDRLVTFATSGDVTVRIQAGAEGVGFDQLVLSSARFLKSAPHETVVAKTQ
jgi:hypothetical protein